MLKPVYFIFWVMLSNGITLIDNLSCCWTSQHRSLNHFPLVILDCLIWIQRMVFLQYIIVLYQIDHTNCFHWTLYNDK